MKKREQIERYMNDFNFVGSGEQHRCFRYYSKAVAEVAYPSLCRFFLNQTLTALVSRLFSFENASSTLCERYSDSIGKICAGGRFSKLSLTFRARKLF